MTLPTLPRPVLKRLPGEPSDEELLGSIPGFRNGPGPLVLKRLPGEPSDEELMGPLPGFRRNPPPLVLKRIPGEPSDEELLGPIPGFRYGPAPLVLKRIPGEPSDEELLGPIPGFRYGPGPLVLKRIPGELTDEELMGPLPPPTPRAPPPKIVLRRIPGEPSDEELMGRLPPPAPRAPPPKLVLKRIPGEPSDEELMGRLPPRSPPQPPPKLVLRRLPGEPSDEEAMGPLRRNVPLTPAAKAAAPPPGFAEARSLAPEANGGTVFPGESATLPARATWERANGPLARPRSTAFRGGALDCAWFFFDDAPTVDATKVAGIGIIAQDLLASGTLRQNGMILELTLDRGHLDGWVKDGWIGVVAFDPDPRVAPAAHSARVDQVGILIQGLAGPRRTLSIVFDTNLVPPLAVPAKLQQRDVRVMVTPDDGRAIHEILRRQVANPPKNVIVELPAGVLRVGVPWWPGNEPILLPSKVALRGAGPELTLLRLADEVMQRKMRGLLDLAGKPYVEIPSQRGADFFINQSSPTIHHDWVGKFINGDATVRPRDEQLEISGMTLDGNKEHQSLLWVGGGDPTVWVEAGAGPNTLVSDKFFADIPPDPTKGILGDYGNRLACITLTDGQRESTPSNVVNIKVDPMNPNTHFADLQLRVPPTNAKWQARIYQRARKSTPDEEQKGGAENWARRPIFNRAKSMQAFNAGVIAKVNLKDPPDPLVYDIPQPGDEDLPGPVGKWPRGLGDRGPARGGRGTGISLHNARDVLLHDLRIVDMASSGLIAAADTAYGRLDNLCLERVDFLGCGWFGLGVAGEGRGWHLRKCLFRFNHGAADFEATDSPYRKIPQGPLKTTYLLDDVLFDDCVMEDNGGTGVQFAPPWNGTLLNMRLHRCELRRHTVHVSMRRGPRGVDAMNKPLPLAYAAVVDFEIFDSLLDEAAQSSVLIAVPYAIGRIDRNTILRSGNRPFAPPHLEPSAQLTSAISVAPPAPGLGGSVRFLSIISNHLGLTPAPEVLDVNLHGAIGIAPLQPDQQYAISDNCLDTGRPGQRSVLVRVDGSRASAEAWYAGIKQNKIVVHSNRGNRDPGDYEVHLVYNEDGKKITDTDQVLRDSFIERWCEGPVDGLPNGDAVAAPPANVVPGVGAGIDIGPVVLVDPLYDPPRGDPFPRQWLPNWKDLPPAIRMRSRW